MNVSSYFDHWAKNFHKFKIEVMREIQQHPIAAIAMIIFPFIGIAAICVWGVKKVFLSGQVEEEQKVHRTGLSVLKNRSPNNLGVISGNQFDHNPRIQNPIASTENTWLTTAASTAGLALGVFGFMALLHYFISKDIGKLTSNVTSSAKFVSQILPIGSVTDAAANSFNSSARECLANDFTTTHSNPAPSIPYNPINLIPIFEFSNVINMSATSAFTDKRQCPNRNFANLTTPGIIKAFTENLLSEKRIDPQKVFEPMPKNDISQLGALGLLIASIFSIFACTFFIIPRIRASSVETTQNKIKTSHKLSNRQLTIVQNNRIKLKQIHSSEMKSLFSCLGINTEDEEICPEGDLNLLAWVAIGNAKLDLIKEFNDLTPEGINKLKYSSSFAEIGQKYKTLSIKLHPDHGGDQEKSKQLTECWKNNFVSNVLRIYNKGKDPEENLIFSTNTDHLIELDNKMNRSQIYFEQLYKPFKLKQLVNGASTKVESEFRIESSSEESYSDDEEYTKKCVELDFLKTSLIVELNQLAPDGIEKLSEKATFQEIGLSYLKVQGLFGDNKELSDNLKQFWKTGFIETMKEIFKSESFDDEEEIAIDIDRLIDLDQTHSKLKDKMQNLKTSDVEVDDFVSSSEGSSSADANANGLADSSTEDSVSNEKI